MVQAPATSGRPHDLVRPPAAALVQARGDALRDLETVAEGCRRRCLAGAGGRHPSEPSCVQSGSKRRPGWTRSGHGAESVCLPFGISLGADGTSRAHFCWIWSRRGEEYYSSRPPRPPLRRGGFRTGPGTQGWLRGDPRPPPHRRGTGPRAGLGQPEAWGRVACASGHPGRGPYRDGSPNPGRQASLRTQVGGQRRLHRVPRECAAIGDEWPQSTTARHPCRRPRRL